MRTAKGKKTLKPYRTHHEATVESLRRDPAFAAAYLSAVLEDGDRAEITTALRAYLDYDEIRPADDSAIIPA